jgi:hypothetical protein
MGKGANLGPEKEFRALLRGHKGNVSALIRSNQVTNLANLFTKSGVWAGLSQKARGQFLEGLKALDVSSIPDERHAQCVRDIIGVIRGAEEVPREFRDLLRKLSERFPQPALPMANFQPPTDVDPNPWWWKEILAVKVEQEWDLPSVKRHFRALRTIDLTVLREDPQWLMIYAMHMSWVAHLFEAHGHSVEKALAFGMKNQALVLLLLHHRESVRVAPDAETFLISHHVGELHIPQKFLPRLLHPRKT